MKKPNKSVVLTITLILTTSMLYVFMNITGLTDESGNTRPTTLPTGILNIDNHYTNFRDLNPRADSIRLHMTGFIKGLRHPLENNEVHVKPYNSDFLDCRYSLDINLRFAQKTRINPNGEITIGFPSNNDPNSVKFNINMPIPRNSNNGYIQCSRKDDSGNRLILSNVVEFQH